MKLSLAVPGRTELAGNHTDHQGGRVLAAAVDLYILARAETTAEQTAILRSDGFGELRIDLGDLRPEASEPGTAEALAALGEVSGRTLREDLVEAVFSRFCVGK